MTRQRRAAQKPITDEFTKPERIARFLERHAPTIAALSVLVSAIGLLVAGLSAWTAWEQVKIISRDRQIPFKAIVFEQQTDAMADVLQEMAEFQSAALCGQTIQQTAAPAVGIEYRQECVDETGRAYRELEISTKRAVNLWQSGSQNALRTFLLDAARVNVCLSHALIFKDAGIELPNNAECKVDLKAESDGLLNLEMVARKAMAEDLKSTSTIE